ncbi:MAG: UDP-glucose 4-epimerase GalE [Desulfobacteraceae bacterium 4572_35.1]|nr:MAG: UDP-glucose 4-epimerase GalE [Desulfobacteraceae bacterium 4572_35.1]
MVVLVTGGAGYIGSHTVVELLKSGYDVVVLDNLSNSSAESLLRVEKITGRKLEFVHADIRERRKLDELFRQYDFSAVIHFAGLKAVGESVAEPLRYYDNNVGGTITLCQAMEAAGVFRLVFSSSATVYGEPEQMPILENFTVGGVTNPYGRSKWIIEQVLEDLSCADPRWSIALLRYFNPVGAHESGMIGEDPDGVPNNLLPYITQVAVGRLQQLSVFGDDYSTKDGTGVRDYIHVCDLASGHVKALDFLENHNGAQVWNLGTGHGYSVLDMVHAFEEVSGCKVDYKIEPRRTGDIGECWSDPSKARRELGWQAQRSLHTMMADAWRWQQQNPHGYEHS